MKCGMKYNLVGHNLVQCLLTMCVHASGDLQSQGSSSSPLYSPARVRALLQQYGLRPTKSLGQNFLIDGNILRAIAKAGGAEQGVNVLEVGPGLGVLTYEMASRGAKVTSLEKDERLRPVLEQTLSGLDANVNLVWGDALEFEYDSLAYPTRVIANLPYYITGPLLSRFMAAKNIISATVLVQKEVAARLTAQPQERHYGFLSALAALHGTVTHVRDVPKGAFFPAPEVTSSVVRLEFDRGHAAPSREFLDFVDAVLSYRRKTLRNNLKMAGYEADAVAEALNAANLATNVRAEDVSLKLLQQLAQHLGIQIN